MVNFSRDSGISTANFSKHKSAVGRFNCCSQEITLNVAFSVYCIVRVLGRS